MPALSAITDTLDGIPEPLRPFYRPARPEDGVGEGFVLNVEGRDGFALENVKALRNAVAAERKARDAAERAARELDALKGLGVELSAIPDRLARLSELEKLDPEREADRLAEQRAAARVERLQARAKAESERLTAEAQRYRRALEKAVVESAIDRALAEAPATNPEAVRLKILSAIRVRELPDGDEPFAVEIVDSSGAPMFDAQGRPLDASGFVQTLRADKAWAAMFRPEPRAGAGVGQPGTGTGQIVSREQFEAMGPNDRRAFIRAGGRIG